MNLENGERWITIAPTRLEFAAPMQALTDAVYDVAPGDDPGECLRADHFRHHLALFPEGQFVALMQADDPDQPQRVVGLTASMRIDFDPENPFVEPWTETISGGWLRRHTPAGEWMYGVESCVHPDVRGAGVGSRLMDARFAVAKALNLRGMVAGGTLMDYCQHAELSPAEYLEAVKAGRIFDGNVSKQIRKGFTPVALIPHYVDDPCALGWGAVIVWHNPDYDPSRPILRELPPGFTPPLPTFPLRPRTPIAYPVEEQP